MKTADFIKQFSAKTWSDIRFARNKLGIVRLGEVTVTQNLILSIAYRYYTSNKLVHLFEARSEKFNGNDIELFISNGRGKLIAYPCQAKIVDKTKREIYSQLNHSSKSTNLQIDALISYGRRLQGYPLYLLYNYSQDSHFRQTLVSEIADSYGCSYVPATYLKHRYCPANTWQTPLPAFKDLHPSIGKPFYHLFTLGNGGTQAIKSELTSTGVDPSNLIDWTIREYTLDELQSDEDWDVIDYGQDYADLGRASNPDSRNNKRNTFDDEVGLFAPKYRIVFTE